MRRDGPRRLRAFALAFALALAAPLAAADHDVDPAIAIAVRTLDRLDAGEYQAIVDTLTPQAQAAIDADGLARVWTALPAQLGAAQGRGEPTLATRGPLRVVTIPLRHAQGTLNAIVALDAQDRIAGLQLQPTAAVAAPAPAAPAGVREQPFAVGNGERALPGTLSLPAGAGPFPAVVLVHGSGPQDRDQTLGPNRPFLDIAHGLAARGIAVLRYDKRSRARPQDYAHGDFGVDAETTDDAVAALAALRATPGIDPERVFVFGHSLGAMLAPRIAARAPGSAGAILFASPSRPLLDVLVEQVAAMAARDGTVSAAERDAIARLEAGIARLRAGEDVPAAEAPLGQSSTYWRSIEAVDPVADAHALGKPLLVLHGGRDIQVTDADWRGWQRALAQSPRVRLQAYPALSHLGIAGEGPGSPADYEAAGHVDATLLDDVANWIKGHGHE
ncbi:MAG: alpha/beta fold hydrolase [Proteobacteria bacterium]|nr:alpha/beta fold hydrolase [Pseudomonadota bacterium]